MTTVFDHYARYYDLLYQNKDYIAEADFVHHLIQTHAPHAKSILELGCGTAHHATLLANKGYCLHGVDQSETMLQRGNERLEKLSETIQERIQLVKGDVRDIRLNQTFDVVISLFHVISYQTTNEDLHAVFTTAKEHLNPGGIFIFDCWYGPAVLNELPSVKVKHLEDEYIKITRIAEPDIKIDLNCVDVKYTLFIKEKESNKVEIKEESHRMRYLFTPELKLFLEDKQLIIKDHSTWMEESPPSLDSWSAYYIMQDTTKI